MPYHRVKGWIDTTYQWMTKTVRRGKIPAGPLTIVLAAIVGILAGYGSVVFTWLIDTVQHWTLDQVIAWSAVNSWALIGLALVPMVGIVIASWITRKYAPEAQGHGVPEVIKAVARDDGVIRPQVALVKILASGICIGLGGSIGREGPIVQIGSALGSTAGQLFKLSARNMKALAASGAAAGISATFHAPIAGVIFASEVILGNFAVESLTPIVIAAVLADVVQQHVGEHGVHAAFPELPHDFSGHWYELPSYIVLGILCGIAAVYFTKLLYFMEDETERRIPVWWHRAVVCGLLVGAMGTGAYFAMPVPPTQSSSELADEEGGQILPPPLYGVGYNAIEHVLHLENSQKSDSITAIETAGDPHSNEPTKNVYLDQQQMAKHLLWLVPLLVLKPFATSLTLAGGGSGGIFAPSLFIGATVGATFGILINMIMPEVSAHPGEYALVGMGAVVAGTTHGVLSAILIVYEMTGDYPIILPIMAAAGISSMIARWIDPESIYEKKLSRRGESIARSHDLHRVEHVKVRDVMVRNYPSVTDTDNLMQITTIARANPHIESLPVMDKNGKLIGIIRPEDLHRVLDTDVSPYLVNAHDIALMSPISVSPEDNLLEALRDFGSRDVDTLPVEVGQGEDRKLIGLLLRADVMSRYREEVLAKH
ncbi:MAG: hypothetical protein COA78_18280 [Blastopirellula sp.]|nr:MAG: hypothetical protein COA78_18280 [Blastopirellula sp.]